MAGLRHVHAGRLRHLELQALVLDPLQGAPGRERIQEAVAERVRMPGDRVQALVVGRKHGRGAARASPRRTSAHEAVLVAARVGATTGRRSASETRAPTAGDRKQHRRAGRPSERIAASPLTQPTSTTTAGEPPRASAEAAASAGARGLFTARILETAPWSVS